MGQRALEADGDVASMNTFINAVLDDYKSTP